LFLIRTIKNGALGFSARHLLRSEIVFLAQVALIFLIATFAVVNLALAKTCEETTAWVAILSSAVGYMIPRPKL